MWKTNGEWNTTEWTKVAHLLRAHQVKKNDEKDDRWKEKRIKHANKASMIPQRSQKATTNP